MDIKDLMRTFILFAMVVVMSTLTVAQTLPVPPAITDPKLVASKSSAQVEQAEQSLSIERLYMTRAIGSTTWSPDGKSIAFIANISGRNNVWLVSADGGWLVCANRDSDNLVVFKVDPATGRLTATGQTATVPQAVCVLFCD